MKNEEIIMFKPIELKKSLSIDFFRLRDFFANIYKGEYKYIILSTRRCLILADLFINEIFGTSEKNEKFISDHALCLILNNLTANDRICIVDDILIHGRKIKELYQSLLNAGIRKENIDIQVCLKNNTTNLDGDNLNLNFVRDANVSLWRDSSNRIVECILQNEIPYVSYMLEFYSNSNYDGSNEKIHEFYNCPVNVLDTHNITLDIAYGKYNSKLHLLNEVSYLNCVRRYQYASGKTILIPYVFLKSINIQNAESFFKTISNLLKDSGLYRTSELFDSRKYEANCVNLLFKYQFSMLTGLMSFLYGIYLYGDNKNVYFDAFSGVLKYSLTHNKDEFLTELNTISPELAENILSSDFVKSSEYALDDLQLESNYSKEFSEHLQSLFMNEDDNCCDRWDDFVYESFCVDEDRAKKDEPRYAGIPVEYIYNQYCKRNKKADVDEQEISLINTIVGTWDIGRTSCTAAINTQHGYISNCVSPGEQAYRTTFMKYIDALQCIYYVIAERPSSDTAEDSLRKFCMYLDKSGEVFGKYKIQIKNLAKIILTDFDSCMLKTLMGRIKDNELALEVNEYVLKHREGII